MADTDKTIALAVSKYSKYIEAPCHIETFKPGTFLMRESGGGLAPYALTSNPETCLLIATENIKLGGTIDTPYEIDDIVMARICLPGDEVLAWCDGLDVPYANHEKLYRLSSGTHKGMLARYDAAPDGFRPCALALEDYPISEPPFMMRVEILRS